MPYVSNGSITKAFFLNSSYLYRENLYLSCQKFVMLEKISVLTFKENEK